MIYKNTDVNRREKEWIVVHAEYSPVRIGADEYGICLTQNNNIVTVSPDSIEIISAVLQGAVKEYKEIYKEENND